MHTSNVSHPYDECLLPTAHGPVGARHYPRPGAVSGIIWVGGMGGFWDGPAGDLYTRLSEALVREDITSLRINVRVPTDLNACVVDTVAGIAFMQDRQIHRLALVGHALAAAAVIQAAVHSGRPDTVVTLAAQSQGAELVGQLPAGCSILFIHGTSDEVLHVSNSEYLSALAHQPKEVILYEGARHGLEEVAPEVQRHVHEWLRRHLRPSGDEALLRAS